MSPSPTTVESARVLRPGTTCWRLARADRFALIVDASAYFAALKAAMTAARDSILIVGWDFDTRIRLTPGAPDDGWPDTLGAFLNALVKRRPGLRIHVLKWDVGLLATLVRGSTPLFVLDWLTGERVRFRLDRVHPFGASHHQKIAVIDDALAFCGGIDITVGRWDTREHRDGDARRRSPWGYPQDPWHDMIAAVDGDAARALGDLARARWRHATGEDLTPVAPGARLWPPDVRPLLEDVEVGISRTQPGYAGEREAREIEAFACAAIAGATRSIYIESQYFASRRVGDALAARLAEPGGPEIVVVNPLVAEGWLEEEAMGSARVLLVERLRAVDREGRLRLLYPVTETGTPIYVHAKIMIVDDRILKVGSSNLNNRSMGLDTECDLGLEAVAGDPDAGRIREAILRVRDDLLAEHLGTTTEAVRAAIEGEEGSLVAAVDALRRDEGRSLRPIPLPEFSAAERALAEARVLDPDRPEPIGRVLRRLAR